MKIKIGDKAKMIKDIPSINGMLHKGSIVKVDEIDGLLKIYSINKNMSLLN